MEVKRLDHGDSACLSLWDIKELTPELAILPLQAVQVSLANVSTFHHINLSLMKNVRIFSDMRYRSQDLHT